MVDGKTCAKKRTRTNETIIFRFHSQLGSFIGFDLWDIERNNINCVSSQIPPPPAPKNNNNLQELRSIGQSRNFAKGINDQPVNDDKHVNNEVRCVLLFKDMPSLTGWRMTERIKLMIHMKKGSEGPPLSSQPKTWQMKPREWSSFLLFLFSLGFRPLPFSELFCPAYLMTSSRPVQHGMDNLLECQAYLVTALPTVS